MAWSWKMNGLLAKARKVILGIGQCVSNKHMCETVQCTWETTIVQFSWSVERACHVEVFRSDHLKYWSLCVGSVPCGCLIQPIRVCKNILELLHNCIPLFNFCYFLSICHHIDISNINKQIKLCGRMPEICLRMGCVTSVWRWILQELEPLECFKLKWSVWHWRRHWLNF